MTQANMKQLPRNHFDTFIFVPPCSVLHRVDQLHTAMEEQKLVLAVHANVAPNV